MSLLSLDINPLPSTDTPVLLAGSSRHPRLTHKSMNDHYVPFRGLAYSLIFHEIVIVVMMFLPSYYGPRPESWTEKNWEVTPIPKDVLYLPNLGGGSEGGSPKKGSEEGSPGPKGSPGSASPRGISYAGNQEIVSNPPNPT